MCMHTQCEIDTYYSNTLLCEVDTYYSNTLLCEVDTTTLIHCCVK